jgi:NADH:ubiquinone oxidoreductase subunit E
MTTVSRQQREQLRSEIQKAFPERERTHLLPALHWLHGRYGHLPAWAMEVLGWHLRVPATEVYQAATSYTELRVKQPGKRVLRVCTGAACLAVGGQQLLDTLCQRLNLKPGQTSPDGSTTLEETPCAFLCALAPVVGDGHQWRGHVSPGALNDLLHSRAHH